MSLQWILGWWNLIYLAPFLIALVYLGLYVSTGISFGETDVDAEVGVDHDIEVDHGIEGNHDVAVQHDVGFEHHLDADHHVDHHNVHHDAQEDGAQDDARNISSGFSAMSLLYLVGFGKVPLTLWAMILLIVWGISGFATNQFLRPSIPDGDRLGLTSLPVAAAIALTLTALIARLLHRVMPTDASNVKSMPQLVGEHGTAILPIDDAFGLAKVLDGSGVGIQVPCRVAPGQESIPADHAVVLMRFDRKDRIFYVTTPDRMRQFGAAPARP